MTDKDIEKKLSDYRLKKVPKNILSTFTDDVMDELSDESFNKPKRNYTRHFVTAAAVIFVTFVSLISMENVVYNIPNSRTFIKSTTPQNYMLLVAKDKGRHTNYSQGFAQFSLEEQLLLLEEFDEEFFTEDELFPHETEYA